MEAGSQFVLSTPMAKQKSNGVLVVSSQVSAKQENGQTIGDLSLCREALRP